MAFSLGDVFLTVKGKTEGLKEAVGGVKDVVAQTEQGVKKVGTFADGFRDFAKVTGGALVTVGAGLTAYAKSANDFTVDYVKNAKQISRETGASVEEASRLTYALGRVGISTEDASAVFGIFSKKIAAATKDSEDNKIAIQGIQTQMEKTKFEIDATTKEIQLHGDKSGELGIKLRGLQSDYADLKNKLDNTGTAFDKLGINIKDANGKQKDFQSILLEVADKFKGMPDGIDKTSLSMELFGRSGKEMIPLLNRGSDGIAELEKQADKLGLTLNEKTIGGVAKLIEAQKKMKENSDAIKIAVGTLTAPVLANFYDQISELLGKFQSLNPEMKGAVANVLAFGGPVAGAAGSVLTFLANLGSAQPLLDGFISKVPVVGTFFSSFGAFLTNPWVALIALIVVAVGLLLDHFGQLQPTLDAIKTNVQNLWDVFTNLLKPAIDSIKNSLDQLLPPGSTTTEMLKTLAEVVGKVLVVTLTVFAAVFLGVLAALAYGAAYIGQWAVGIKNEFTGAVNWIQNTWNTLSALPGRFASWLGSIPGIVSGAISSAVGAISGFFGTFSSAGRGLINAFADGISSAFGRVRDVVKGGLDAVRRLLPFSDAKEGPLSDLTLSGRRLMETIATGVGQGSGALHSAVEDGLGGLPSAVISAGVTSTASGGTSSLTPSANPGSGGSRTEVHLHMQGMVSRSRAELRDIMIDGLEAVDEKLLAQGRPTLLGGTS
jgi:phage-related protein/uncharacterized membrane-anchored protein YhcB (DUF1043 family)